jgi:hypothetical protein
MNTHQKMKNKKKLDFYTSLMSRSRYVMKVKTELLTNFKSNLKNVNPNGGNVAERNVKSMQFFFLENC